jgi:hypothetical protein
MNIAIFFICIVIALIDARSFAVSMRGPYAVEYPLGRTVVGFVSLLATLGLLVWGFTHLPWYWPVAALVLGVIAQALVVTRSSLGPLLGMAIVLQLVVIAGAAFLWFLG